MVKKDKNKALIIIVLLVVAIIFFLSYKVKDDSAFEITYYDKNGNIVGTDSLSEESFSDSIIPSLQAFGSSNYFIGNSSNYFIGNNCVGVNDRDGDDYYYDSLQECFGNNTARFKEELRNQAVTDNKVLLFNKPPDSAVSASLKIRIVNDGNVPLVFSVSDFISRYTQIG